MANGSAATKYGSVMSSLFLLIAIVHVLHADPRCVSCHAKEDAAYANTGMAKSLLPVGNSVLPPDGAFEHSYSQSKFTIHSAAGVMTQSLARKDETAEQQPAFTIGSGEHVTQYLTLLGNQIFQSPAAFYTRTKSWDIAPGFEGDHYPDFSKPATSECLFCHAGKPLPVKDTVNSYQEGAFAATTITCERCHGDATQHLSSPTIGSIINPVKLIKAARASVCEQCHLTGESQIPNPGKSNLDYRPGLALEDFYTTYVAAQSAGKPIKQVGYSEQLAASKCARTSGDQMWCGSCHNPHEQPAQPVSYYRNRCLTCHATTLKKAHAANQDCMGCHMPKLQVKDGSHLANTDHRILANPAINVETVKADTISAWREPDDYVKNRNLGMALAAVGLQQQSSEEMMRGYKLMTDSVKLNFPKDAELYAAIGLLSLKANESKQALQCFRTAIGLRPKYVPYYVNLATALLDDKQTDEAVKQLEKARMMDPRFQPPVQLLHLIYRKQGDKQKSDAVLADYDKAMNSSHH